MADCKLDSKSILLRFEWLCSVLYIDSPIVNRDRLTFVFELFIKSSSGYSFDISFYND